MQELKILSGIPKTSNHDPELRFRHLNYQGIESLGRKEFAIIGRMTGFTEGYKHNIYKS